MTRIIALFWLGIVSACAVPPSQQPTVQNTAPIVTVSPTEIFSIPDQPPPERVFATLPRSNLTGLGDREIARLLVEEFLNQQMSDDTKINKISEYEIIEIRPQDQIQGRFSACYIMTPATEIFVMTSPARELEDGRVEACNVFGASKDAVLYYLSGYYGG